MGEGFFLPGIPHVRPCGHNVPVGHCDQVQVKLSRMKDHLSSFGVKFYRSKDHLRNNLSFSTTFACFLLSVCLKDG